MRLSEFIQLFIMLVMVLIIIGMIVMTIWVNIYYWNTPVGEIPYWVAWFVFG